MAVSESMSYPLLLNTDGQSISVAFSQSMSHPDHLLSITEYQSTSAVVSQSTSHPLLSVPEGQYLSGAVSAESSPHVSLAFTDFQQNVAEKQAITQLEHKFFQYKHSLLDKESPILQHSCVPH